MCMGVTWGSVWLVLEVDSTNTVGGPKKDFKVLFSIRSDRKQKLRDHESWGVCALTLEGRVTYSTNSDQTVENRVWVSMNLVVVIWFDPCSLCFYFLRTYFDLWYRWIFYNGMDHAEWNVVVKYRSETYYWTQKVNGENYGVDKYWVVFF